LPPGEFREGTRPIQAAKSRPFENLPVGGAGAAGVTARTGPTPGIVIGRRAVPPRRASALGPRPRARRIDRVVQASDTGRQFEADLADGRRQARSGFLQRSLEPRELGHPLRRDEAVPGQMTAQCGDGPAPVPHEQAARLKVRPAARFRSLFAATNRIVGRDAASAIASASAMSSFRRFANGFTQAGAIRRAS
jgi:hypothetical protein